MAPLTVLFGYVTSTTQLVGLRLLQGVGMGLGALIAGSMAGYVGFKVPFYVVGGFCLVAAAWVWRWAKESIAPGEWALDEV